MKTSLRSWLAAVVCSCSVAGPAAAQTGPELMLLPWQEGQIAQLNGRVSTQDTETDRVDFDLDLTRYVASGRFRLSPGSEHDPAIGFRYTHLDLNTADPMLPSRLVDVSVALGGQLGTTDFGLDWGDWQVGYTVGVGYAGDVPFHDGDAWYALGSLFAVQTIDRDTQWIVALQYDGNRAFLPDIPLPSVTYRARYNEQLTYALGFPFSSLTWKPDDRWTVLLRTALFISVTARVEFEPTDGLVLYAAYEREVDAFQLDGDDSSRRLIFSQQRVEAGVRYTIYDNTTLTAAVGYAFAQEFERGYDSRDTTTVRDLDDAVYVRVGVEVGF
ncbi:MAG: hypothetical protein ACIAXF_15510 [Phycisphaerales bacterium JB063]